MSRVPFAHASEAELARIFDFYQIVWQYEPRSFPIAWNDLYLELTVAKPIRNSRKNRKIRLLRSHHPRINVKLFTRRDIERVFSRSMKRAS
jgi:hypoxanthine phosphoribosyltransferase